MKVIVEKDMCIGCGLCASVCPKVYEMQDNIAVVVVAVVPADEEGNAQQAANDCPVEAIKIQ
jgi:ferredoxin